MIKGSAIAKGYEITYKHSCGVCCDGANEGEIKTTKLKAKNLEHLTTQLKRYNGIGELVSEPIPATWTEDTYQWSRSWV